MENINEQFNRLFCELDLTDEQAAMIKKLQRDVDAALHQPPVMRRSEQLVCSCGSRLVKTTGGYHCGNAKCSV